MLGIIIYLVGYALAYLIFRKIRTKEYADLPRNWSEVIFTFCMALLSWVLVGIYLLYLLLELILGIIDKMDKKSEPPKWL